VTILVALLLVSSVSPLTDFFTMQPAYSQELQDVDKLLSKADSFLDQGKY
jgi:hypothetical protein